MEQETHRFSSGPKNGQHETHHIGIQTAKCLLGSCRDVKMEHQFGTIVTTPWVDSGKLE